MPRLFDAYIIVDWSANSKPKTGKDSIWIGVRARDARLKYQFTSVNPKTRLEARKLISDLAQRFIDRKDRVLIGMDFPFGYPVGTAQAAGLQTNGNAPWQNTYEYLSKKVVEKPDNSNARFALAAGFNYAISKEPHPFWGCPASKESSTLSTTKGDFSAPGSLPEYREAERFINQTYKASPKSLWQLFYNGSVGSQALLGIPAIQYLRDEIERSQIWPFETGFKLLTPDHLENTTCVLAEIYPSVLSVRPQTGEIMDEAQVRMLCEHLESLDSAGELSVRFGPPNSLDKGKIEQIEQEEGWILA